MQKHTVYEKASSILQWATCEVMEASIVKQIRSILSNCVILTPEMVKHAESSSYLTFMMPKLVKVCPARKNICQSSSIPRSYP